MNEIDSIDKPPLSNLQKEGKIPISYMNGPLNSNKLRFLGWLSIFSALLTIPIVKISLMSGADPTNGSFLQMMNILSLISTVIGVYLLLMFKVFINYRFEYADVNKHINVIVLLLIMMEISSFLFGETSVKTEAFDIETISFFLLSLPFGIVLILFGKRLLVIASQFKFLRMFSWINIAMGICLLSIVLLLLVVPLGVAYDILLALIFFTASNELETVRTP